MTVLLFVLLAFVSFLAGGAVALHMRRALGHPKSIEAIGNDGGRTAHVRLECENGTVLISLDDSEAYAVSNEMLQLAAVLAPRAQGS